MAESQSPAHDPKGAAAEAVAVHAVELAAACVMIVLAVVAQVAQRHASEPDFTSTWRRRWAKQAERGWAAAAGVAWRRAETFRAEYEQLSHD